VKSTPLSLSTVARASEIVVMFSFKATSEVAVTSAPVTVPLDVIFPVAVIVDPVLIAPDASVPANVTFAPLNVAAVVVPDVIS
jgi:hypothetical protein